jgi:hypothetical protein
MDYLLIYAEKDIGPQAQFRRRARFSKRVELYQQQSRIEAAAFRYHKRLS